MKYVLDNNLMKVSALQVSAVGIIPEVAVVKNVRVANVVDADGKKTDKVEAVRYDCVNMENFSTFTLKVETNRPVVTREQIEESDESVCITIPVRDTVIRPYSIEYGSAKVTIVAPFVKLAEN